MKPVGAVRHQLKQVRFRHLKKRLENELRRFPHNCAHNRTLNHPKVIAEGGDPCGVCTHPGQDGHILCDLAWGGYARARECPLFEHRFTKDEVKDSFAEWLSTAKLHEIAVEYPDMAALMWVLQEEAPDREVEIEDDEDWDPEDTEEEHTVEVAGVKLVATSEEAAATANSEIREMRTAFDTVNRQRDGLEADLRSERGESAKLRDHLSTAESHIAAIEGELAEARTRLNGSVVSTPRVSWWHRLFGGPP